jgi:hypothetical protein
MSPLASRVKRLEVPKHVIDHGGYIRRSNLAEAGCPGVVLAAPDENLCANPVVRQRMSGIRKQVTQSPDAEPAVARQGLERQEWVQGRADYDPLGQNATNLGGFS